MGPAKLKVKPLLEVPGSGPERQGRPTRLAEKLPDELEVAVARGRNYCLSTLGKSNPHGTLGRWRLARSRPAGWALIIPGHNRQARCYQVRAAVPPVSGPVPPAPQSPPPPMQPRGHLDAGNGFYWVSTVWPPSSPGPMKARLSYNVSGSWLGSPGVLAP